MNYLLLYISLSYALISSIRLSNSLNFPNIQPISHENMIRRNKSINRIYVRDNKDLILRLNDRKYYYYHNINKTNIYLDFLCDFSFVSDKYLPMFNKTMLIK